MIHAASYFYHEKSFAWVSISMHTCDPVPIVVGVRLAALRAAGAPLLQVVAAAVAAAVVVVVAIVVVVVVVIAIVVVHSSLGA